MGLDIHVGADNYKELYDEAYMRNWKDNFRKFSLSREFCHLMFSYYTSKPQSELQQIAIITNIDISPLHEMFSYEYEDNKEKFERNINKVTAMISKLIKQLSDIYDLQNTIITKSYMLNGEYYFSDFNLDKGDGYINNNLGQDLRNLEGFLEYAKERGTNTVWFHYE